MIVPVSHSAISILHTTLQSRFKINIEKVLSLKFQWTPLHNAAEQGDIDTLKKFLGKGFNINTKDEDGVCESVLLVDLQT